MQDETQNRIAAFVRQACGDTTFVFHAPAADDASLQVCLILIGLAPNLASRNDVRHPLEIFRRYLVCAAGPDESSRATLVQNLLFQALKTRDVQLEPDPPADSLWLALGLTPQAAFILRVPVLCERPVIEGPPVKTVQLDLSPTTQTSANTLESKIVTATEKSD